MIGYTTIGFFIGENGITLPWKQSNTLQVM